MKDYFGKLKKCLTKNNNVVKFSACAVIAFMLFLVACKFIHIILHSIGLKEGFASANNKLVYFHMNGCGHCKKFNPVWDKFTEFAGANNIKVDKIEAGKQKELQQGLSIKGYPTILELDSNNKKVKEFTGDRTLPALKTFCQVKK